MRVVILGINYPPEQTGVAPYTRALAERLAEAHDVTVVSGMPHYPNWEVPPNFRRWRIERDEGGVHVIRVRHYVPKSQSVIRRLIFELSWSVRAVLAGARLKPDVVIAVVPALFAMQSARLIARLTGAPYGVVVHDIMGSAAAQSGIHVGKLVSRLIVGVERSGLSAAHAVTTIHPRLADELQRLGHRRERPDVIYNWTHLTERPRADARLRVELGWAPDEIVVLHSGNMGLKQNLEVVVDAANLAQHEGRPVHFVLAGAGNQKEHLRRYARGCSRVSFLDYVPPGKYMDLLAAADILLVNERPGMQVMSLPSKLTSYLVAGRPIVVAADSDGATAEFVRASGGGVVIDAGDAGLLLECVEKIASDPALGERLADQGKVFACQYLGETVALAAYERWVDALAVSRRGVTRHCVRGAQSPGC